MTLSREQLDLLNDKCVENIDIILGDLGIDHNHSADEIRMSCPIHGGDNSSSLMIDTVNGRWKCFASSCEKGRNDMIGLIMAFREMSFVEAIKHAQKLVGSDGLTATSNKDVYSIVKSSRAIKRLRSNPLLNNGKFTPFPLSTVDGRIESPQYFIDKGFRAETLRHFNVGLCMNPNKIMYNRAFAPVMDDEGVNVVGVTGRIIWDACKRCGEYHNPLSNRCPVDDKRVRKYPKWLHFGFNSSAVLYNFAGAAEAISRTKVAIITEGVKEVWWMYQSGIHNCISMFGLSMSKFHIKKLSRLGCTTLMMALDNDSAGQEGYDKIKKEYGGYFTIKNAIDVVKYDGDIDSVDTGILKALFGT